MATKNLYKFEGKGQSSSENRLDVAQVARRLNISRSSVYRLIHAGDLKAVAFGPVLPGLTHLQKSLE